MAHYYRVINRAFYGIFEYILHVKARTLCLMVLLISLSLFSWCLRILLYSEDVKSNHRYIDNGKHPIILWWTPFTGEVGVLRQCGSQHCFFTNNRTYIDHEDLKVLLFYGSSISPDDMPPPKLQPRHVRPLWGLLNEESPKNVALLQHSAALTLFNLSATFSRHSHFPLTLQHLPSMEALTGLDFVVPLSEKKHLQASNILAPVVFVQSDCDTPSERDAYVAELMKHIPVDSYGACLQNKKLPDHLQDAMRGMHHKEFWHLLAQYKFVIAFENAVCEDYITEKLWRPLIIGSIPIYYGSPSIQDWLPNNKSIIKITDFKSPQELAKFILKVNNDDILYESYLRHKHDGEIILNTNLIEHLESRTWSTENEDLESKNFVEEFECFVCEHVHRQMHGQVEDKGQWRVKADHYECPPPVSPLTGKENKDNWWLEQWHQGKAEAKVLHTFFTNREEFTYDQFYDEVGKILFAKKAK